MKNKKFFALIMCFCLMFTSLVMAAPDDAPEISSSNYILINMDTGEVLLENNSGDRKYPASTTKIMTAMLALESLDLDATTTVSYGAVMSIPWDSSRLGLYEGETLTNRDLLTGMMVASGNDAANVLAEAVSGSVEEFVALMNKRAKELGCTGTYFVNTHGYTDENHYTTVSDMAKIAKKAMENPTFREIVKTKYFELPITEKCGTVRAFNTTNNMLTDVRTSKYLYSPATGMKTGYTSASKHCLVASAEKDGVRLICVVLGASEIDGNNMAYVDTKALMDWGFNKYVNKTIVKSGDMESERSIKHAKGEKTVKLVAETDFTVVIDKNITPDRITKNVNYSGDVVAPIAKGEELGTMDIFMDDKLLGTVKLVADKDYAYSWWSAFWGTIGKIVGIFLLIILGAVVVLIVIRQIEYEKRRKQRMRNRNSGR